jgi:hypothetical protein
MCCYSWTSVQLSIQVSFYVVRAYSTNNIEWHLFRQLHTRSWVTTHVTWLLTSTNNIEWHLYRQLHTHSWVTTHNRCHSMLFVLIRSHVTCVFTHERVCNCLYRCHYMLFVLVRSLGTCVFTHEWVCNCLYRSHSMSFVLARSCNLAPNEHAQHRMTPV